MLRHKAGHLSALSCTHPWKGSFFFKDHYTLRVSWGTPAVSSVWDAVQESQAHGGTAEPMACVSCSPISWQSLLSLSWFLLFFFFFFLLLSLSVFKKIITRSWGHLLKLLLIPVVVVMKCVLHIHFTKVVYKDTLDLLSLCR